MSAHEIQDAIRDRIDAYIGLLRGASALFAANPAVTRQQFRDYVERLDLAHDYPGVRGIGFSLRVPPGEEAAVVEQARADGQTRFHIWPEPDGSETHTILYLEPGDAPNKYVLGYNMFSDTVRRAAMERARDTASPAASGKVALKQEAVAGPHKQDGFLVYVPVYEGGVDPGTIAARREKLVGFVYSPFRAGDLLAGIGDNAEQSFTDFTVYDQDVTVGQQMHHTGEGSTGESVPGPLSPDELNVAGRRWILAFQPRPEFAPKPSRALPLMVFGVGLAFALVLFLAMSSQARARAAAERTAAELTRSEIALRQSQASLRRLVESNLIGVVIADTGGKVIEANDAFLSITGYTREDIRASTLSWKAIASEEHADRDRNAVGQPSGTGRRVPVEKEYIRKDGSRVPVLVGTTSVEDAGGASISFIIDLTELRKARGAVAESERRLRTLVEQSPLGIQIFAPDGQILLANKAWERIWESSLNDLQGYNVLQDPQLDKIGLKPFVLQAFSGEPAVVPRFRYDPALNGRPGKPRWVQLYLYPVKSGTGQIREAVLIVQDVTDVKRAEEALQRSEEQLRLVIDALPVLIGYLDQEKRYRLNNQLYEEWFDIPADEIIGKSMREVIGDDAYAIAEPVLERALVGERTAFDRHMLFPDGTLHDLHVSLIPHVGLAGHVEGVVVLAADVTERKNAENERSRLLAAEREARADAETANRTKDEFLATLSHELRTPLNAILGWAQLLRMGGLPEDEITHGLETIERNAKVQAQLVEDLLDLSRIISGKLRLEMRPVDLPIVLDAALDSVRPAAEAKGIRLVPVFDASASPVLGDPGRLQQVFWNLLSNAIKFTPPAGQVELFLQRMDGRAEILVSDSGIGITADFLPYVFDRLRQADSSSTRRHGGLGLGLAIARHLIESHGGTVQARSEGQNRGSTFVVSLPLSLNAKIKEEAGNLSGSDAAPKSLKQRLRGVRVLVVDDEADARDLVSRVLRQDGAEVTSANSAAEALGFINERGPDVLISDIAMPGEDGYDLIRKLRSRGSANGGRVPAIALTAFARNEDRERALEAGYQTHLAKPVEPNQLAAAVAELSIQ
jgi:PAS domain S-box-containing protein